MFILTGSNLDDQIKLLSQSLLGIGFSPVSLERERERGREQG